MKQLIVLAALVVIGLGIYVFMTGDNDSVKSESERIQGEMLQKLQQIES